MDRTAGTPRGRSSPRVPRRPRELARAIARSRPLVPRPPRAVARPRRAVLALRCDRHRVLRTVRHVPPRDPRPRSDRLHLRDPRRRDRRRRLLRGPPSRVRLHLGRDRLPPVRRSRPRVPAVSPAQVSRRPAGPAVVRRRTVSHRSGRHRPVNLHGRQPRSLQHPTRPCALRRYQPSRRPPVKRLVRPSPHGVRIRPVRQRRRRCRPNRTTVRKVAQERRPGSVEPVSGPHRRERTTGSSRRISRRPTCPDAELRCLRTVSSIGPLGRPPSRPSANRPRTRPNGEKPPGPRLRESTDRHGTSNARIWRRTCRTCLP